MQSKTTDAVAVVDNVICSRTTIRAFRPDPVPQSQLVAILDVARMAPSNFNSQPWRVHVVVGAAKRALSEAIARAFGEHSPAVLALSSRSSGGLRRAGGRLRTALLRGTRH